MSRATRWTFVKLWRRISESLTTCHQLGLQSTLQPHQQGGRTFLKTFRQNQFWLVFDLCPVELDDPTTGPTCPGGE